MNEWQSRRSRIEPFYAMDVLAEANRLKAGGADVVSMAVGQPGDPAPEPVLAAARHALRDGRIAYTDALGLAELREVIAGHYHAHYAVDVDPGCIVVTTGSSAAFNLAFLTLFDTADRVAIAAPGYPAYRNILAALDLVPVEIAADDGPYLTAAALRRVHARTPLAGLLFASPANPTGAVIPRDEMGTIIRTARELNICVISDEIYHRLNFTGPDVTALEFDRDVTVINSFSKYYCMTGWRIGWMIVPPPLVRPLECVQQNLYISAGELSQRAAIAAFDATADYERIKQRYGVNRALLMEKLPQIGFRLAAPMDGAFYAYCDVSALTDDSMELAGRILREIHVAVTPGRDFDPVHGNRYLRLSYAGRRSEIAEALERIGNWIRSD